MMLSPSTIAPVCVDRQAAVGVAVVGDAQVGTVLDDRLLQRLQVGGTARRR